MSKRELQNEDVLLPGRDSGQFITPIITVQDVDAGGDVEVAFSPDTVDNDSNVSRCRSREEWRNKQVYILTLLGYAVGLGNVWRFPYLMRDNGGIVFVIPYCIMMAIVGVPLFYLELVVGQRIRRRVTYTWVQLSQQLGGIGISCIWICFLIGIYYNTILCYCFSYLVDSFVYPLPWTNCSTVADKSGIALHEKECQSLLNRTTKYYWYRRTLDASVGYDDPGNYNWWLALYLVVVWMIVYLILIKGTQDMPAVLYFTAVAPYVVLTIFFFSKFFNEPTKSWVGAYRLLRPKWSCLYDPATWITAGSQVFFTLGLSCGCLVVFSSYNPARNNCQKDAITISIINCITSLLAAATVFPMIGLLGHKKYDHCVNQMAGLFVDSTITYWGHTMKYDIYFFTKATRWKDVDNGAHNITVRYAYNELTYEEQKEYTMQYEINDPEIHFEVLSKSNLKSRYHYSKGLIKDTLRDCSIGRESTASGGGAGFVFIGFTETVLNLYWSNFWAFLFFFMLMTLGVDSSFGVIEGVITALQDIYKFTRFQASSIACGVMLFVALLTFPFGWGIYVVDLMDQWTANWTLLVVGLLECIAVGWHYGLARISYDIHLMTGRKPSLYMMMCWKYVSPTIIFFVLVGSVIDVFVDHELTYTTFNVHSNKSNHGEVVRPVPGYVIALGVGLMIFCLMWIPIQWFLRKTKCDLLKGQFRYGSVDFPEEELREERHLDAEKEVQMLSKTEKKIMGSRSLKNLQEHETEHRQRHPNKGSGGSSQSQTSVTSGNQTPASRVPSTVSLGSLK